MSHPRTPSVETSLSADSEDTVRISVAGSTRSASTRQPTLKVVAGPGRDMLGFWILGPGEQLLVGRDDREASVVLSDATVSKRHALIRTDTQGSVVVEDLRSTNGTSVNSLRVSAPVALHPGDNLEIGGVLLRLELLSGEELDHLGRLAQRISEAGSDPLTRLRTRRYLEDDLPELVARSSAAKTPLSCAFLDLDSFKRINDDYGHRVGDEVLARTSRIILADVRDDDVCLRYGGEEILVIFPNTALEAATGAADRLRRAIASHDWNRTAPELRVTASLGVAQRLANESNEAWIHRADRALYAAKASGRNCVRKAT